LGKAVLCETQDPLGRNISANYYAFKNGETAWIELSQASGIALLKEDEKNALQTSTFGTGLQIRHALESGYRNLILGIGGSATNDLGTGIFSALGGKLKDSSGKILEAKGASLALCTQLDYSDVMPSVKDTTITVACDVSNTLLGPAGAAHTYAPQKGASPQDVITLEHGATHFAELLYKLSGKAISKIKGGGAAGGTAAGMLGLFNSTLEPGFDLLSLLTKLEERVKSADLILTGEGKTDNQSQYGKVPFKVAELAKKYKTPVVLFAGSVTANPAILNQAGITESFSIKDDAMTLDYAKANAYRLLKEKALQQLKKYL